MRCSLAVQEERGLKFHIGNCFYRATSTVVRDLGELALHVHSQRKQCPIRVLDVCAGSGIRTLRYARVSDTNLVANDANEQAARILQLNLASLIEDRRALVTSEHACDVLNKARVTSHKFDFVDIDAFGSDAVMYAEDAINALSHGALLYMCAADPIVSTGRNAHIASDVYGACMSSVPAVNEQFVRVVAAAGVRAASKSGRSARPLFSYFHNHSSTARVLLEVDVEQGGNIAFMLHCAACGQNDVRNEWTSVCQICGSTVSDGFACSGPLWVDSLHNVPFLEEMLKVAYSLDRRADNWRSTVKLLNVLVSEADLPPAFYLLGDIGRRIGTSTPARQRIIDELAARGYTSCAPHARRRCLKTDAPYRTVLDATSCVMASSASQGEA